MVTIEKIGTDVCALTGKQAKGVQCQFADGSFQGFLSWKSLKQLLNLRQRQEEGKDVEDQSSR
jgi:hypothetical protein